MRPASPETSVWLHIPGNCHMAGEFTSDRDIRMVFGNLADETSVVFERVALERFARMAHELLAVPVHNEEPAHSIVAAGSPDDPGAPSLASGEDSVFVREMCAVGALVGRYVQWWLGREEPDTTPFPFEEQMLLSARMAALGHGVRELAYAWMAGDDAGSGQRGH